MKASSIGPCRSCRLRSVPSSSVGHRLPVCRRPCGNGPSRSGRRAACGAVQVSPSIRPWASCGCATRARNGATGHPETFLVVNLERDVSNRVRSHRPRRPGHFGIVAEKVRRRRGPAPSAGPGRRPVTQFELVVAQRLGREVNVRGHRLAAGSATMLSMRRLISSLASGVYWWPALAPMTWTSSMPSSLQGLGHHVGGLLLAVDLAAVGDGRAVEQVDGVVGAIVEMPELLLVPGRLRPSRSGRP